MPREQPSTDSRAARTLTEPLLFTVAVFFVAVCSAGCGPGPRYQNEPTVLHSHLRVPLLDDAATRCPPPKRAAPAVCDGRPELDEERSCIRALNERSLAATIALNDLVVITPPLVAEDELTTADNLGRALRFRAHLTLPHMKVGTSMRIAAVDAHRFGHGTLILLEHGQQQRCPPTDARLSFQGRLLIAHASDEPRYLQLLDVEPVVVHSRTRVSCDCSDNTRCTRGPIEPLFLRLPNGYQATSALKLPIRSAAVYTRFPADDTVDCMCERNAHMTCVDLQWRTVSMLVR